MLKNKKYSCSSPLLSNRKNLKFLQVKSCIKAEDQLDPLIILKMYKSAIIRTPSFESAQKDAPDSFKPSQTTMTSQQQKMFQLGMYFPQKVLSTARLDIKRPMEQWDDNVTVRLTSQAFGHIPISAINKIKCYISVRNKLALKVITKSEDTFYHAKRDSAVKIFSLVAWGKLATLNAFSDSESSFRGEITGVILKKSEILGKWEERYVRISAKEGLTSSKNLETSHSLKITHTAQVWTRFQKIRQDSYIVVKLWYGFIKQEFAVPTHAAVQWLQAFCSLLTERT